LQQGNRFKEREPEETGEIGEKKLYNDNKLDDTDTSDTDRRSVCRIWTRWRIMPQVCKVFILDSLRT
jgi:hypothetical protein